MASRVAVVTDSVSDGFYFPLFLSHYRRELPGADIFVVTPAGRASMFDGFGLAGIVELSIDFYDDTVRANAISDLVSDLTQRYTHVLRVDCDEFAIADPRRFSSLQAYIDVTHRDYVTAMGYDIVAAPSDEPLDFAEPILGGQRRYAFALHALNKTCLTRVPLRWGRGFHACQRRPDFDCLFLMHLKRADIDMQFGFGQFIAELTREDAYIRKYYQTPKDEIVSFHNSLFQREKLVGWHKFVDQEFLTDFFAGLRKSPDSGLWDIEYKTSQRLVEIPIEFHGKIGPVSNAPRAADRDKRLKRPPAQNAASNPVTVGATRGRQLHDTALAIGTKFLEIYAPAAPFTVVEIGSQDVNGTLRTALPPRATYVGVDAEPGRNVDIIAAGRTVPLPDGFADITIASSVFEHDKTFWQTFLELCRLTRDGGYLYLSAPSNGSVHRYPQDSWRFYPDAGAALAEWSCENNLDVTLVESFVADRQNDVWNDFVAILRRGAHSAPQRDSFVHSSFPARNIRQEGTDEIVNPRETNEDQELLAAATASLLAIEQRIAAAVPELGIATPPATQVQALTRLAPNAGGLFDAETAPAVFAESYRRVETAIGAVSALLNQAREQAGFRELSLRRRLQKAERALDDPRTLPEYRAYTADRLWFSVDRKDTKCIAGWAMIAANPAQRVQIDLVTEDQPIASQTADRPQPHLVRFGYGDGNYGFRFEFDAKTDIARTGARIIAKWNQEETLLGVLEPTPEPAGTATPS